MAHYDKWCKKCGVEVDIEDLCAKCEEEWVKETRGQLKHFSTRHLEQELIARQHDEIENKKKELDKEKTKLPPKDRFW